VGFLLLGTAAIAAFLIVPPSNLTSEDATAIGPVSTPPGPVPHATILTGTDTSSGTFTLRWQSTVPLTVRLYDASKCSQGPTNCALGTPLASWPSNATGDWGTQGALSFPFVLSWSDTGNTTGSFQALADEKWTTTASVPMLTLILVFGSGGALAVVGATALFLGVFLRSGIYQRPPPPPTLVSQSAEDVGTIAGMSPGDLPSAPG
jgi:hypothetical protein